MGRGAVNLRSAPGPVMLWFRKRRRRDPWAFLITPFYLMAGGGGSVIPSLAMEFETGKFSHKPTSRLRSRLSLPPPPRRDC